MLNRQLLVIIALGLGWLVGCTQAEEGPASPPRPSVPAQLAPSQASPGPAWQVWIVDVAALKYQFVSYGLLPLWAPDGSLLAFESDRPDGVPKGIAVWDGQQMTDLIASEQSPTWFCWESDGKAIVSGTPTRQLRQQLGTGLVRAPLTGGPQLLGDGCIWRAWPHQELGVGFCVGPHGQRYQFPKRNEVLPPEDTGAATRTVATAMRKRLEKMTADGVLTSAAAKPLSDMLQAAANEQEQAKASQKFAEAVGGLGALQTQGKLTPEQFWALLAPEGGGDGAEAAVLVGWAGDGRAISIVTGRGAPPKYEPTRHLAVAQADGKLRTIADLPADLAGLDWTPDLTRLAVVRDRSGLRPASGAGGGAYVVDKSLAIVEPASGSLTDLGQGEYPHWSPNGKLLAYVKPHGQLDRSPLQDMYVVNADGGDKRLVAKAKVNDWRFFTWSPDSRLIAYSFPPIWQGR